MSIKSSLLTFAGDIRFSLLPTKVKYKEIQEALALCEPGDIILCGTDWTLSKLFIPGTIPHLAIFVCPANTIEAISSGVVHQNIFVTLGHTDYFVVLRKKDITPEEQALIVRRAFIRVRNTYDFDFKFIANDGKTVCIELGLRCYEGILDFPLNKYGFVTGDMVYKNKNLKIIYASRIFKDRYIL